MMNRLLKAVILIGMAAVAPAAVNVLRAGSAPAPKYMGVEECWSCHEEPYKGNQYKKWKESKHAEAFASLASADAKKLAQKLGISDPQKNEKCLKCHVTAFGVPKALLGPKFKPENNQCESCHGPGENHIKARLDAEAKEKEKNQGKDIYGDDKERPRIKIPNGEIVSPKPDEKKCRECHNPDSPAFKEFKFEQAKKDIAHPDPRPRPK